ncbi:MAG TPA: cation transporter [Prosthecobacter sp.]|nr:cation transporter [Prosthecobacter sp.]
MKHILILILSLFTIVSCIAGEPVTFTYQGEVAGVMCSACSNHVQTALEKIPGVKNVTVLVAKDGGLPRLEITATSAKITREDCVKALGEQAKMYDVRSLKLAGGK